MKRTTLVVAAAVLILYAWALAGVVPFSGLSYFLVAIPAVAMVFTYATLGGLSPGRGNVAEHYRRNAAGTSRITVAPWIAVLSAAIVLEAVGLLLGGRSPSVPTLSTTVDHLLNYRWERFLMCLVWLLAGGIPLVRLQQSLHAKDS
jgi:hypothetical protein